MKFVRNGVGHYMNMGYWVEQYGSFIREHLRNAQAKSATAAVMFDVDSKLHKA